MSDRGTSYTTLVKHVVNRHRGRLDIQSTPGKGSTFTVILPPVR